MWIKYRWLWAYSIKWEGNNAINISASPTHEWNASEYLQYMKAINEIDWISNSWQQNDGYYWSLTEKYSAKSKAVKILSPQRCSNILRWVLSWWRESRVLNSQYINLPIFLTGMPRATNQPMKEQLTFKGQIDWYISLRNHSYLNSKIVKPYKRYKGWYIDFFNFSHFMTFLLNATLIQAI